MILVPREPQLRSRIVGYGMSSGRGPISKMIHPKGGATLVLSVAGSCRIDGALVPDAALFGVRECPSRMELETGPIDRVLVQFHPAGLSRFTTVSIAALVNRITPADELLPAEALARLMRVIADAPGPAERVAELDALFMELFCAPSALEERIELLAKRMEVEPETAVGVRLRDLPASLRHAERLFGRLVGLSPRRFLRIARFTQARERILARAGESLTEIALAAGYYDQAHLGRDFQRLAATSPGSYLFCSPPIDRVPKDARRALEG